MKKLIVILLIILGTYWLIDHTGPMPFNHEQFGLYDHTAHRILGIIFFITAGIVWWKWKKA